MDLSNQFIIAMPGLLDPHFQKTVTYICQHDDKGSLGVTINRPIDFTFTELAKQMEIEITVPEASDIQIYAGGPVGTNQGFVLHSSEKAWQYSLVINKEFTLSSSRDVVQAIARGEGPEYYLVALGYSGWGAGQIENEILQNSWLNTPADKQIMFDLNYDKRWEAAALSLGIDIHLISNQAGHG